MARLSSTHVARGSIVAALLALLGLIAFWSDRTRPAPYEGIPVRPHLSAGLPEERIDRDPSTAANTKAPLETIARNEADERPPRAAPAGNSSALALQRDTRILPTGDGGFENLQNIIRVAFPPSEGLHRGGSPVEISNDQGHRVIWSPLGMAFSTGGADPLEQVPFDTASIARARGASLTYPSVYPLTDEHYTLEPRRLKHDYTLSGVPRPDGGIPPSATTLSFVGRLTVPEGFLLYEEGDSFPACCDFTTARTLRLVAPDGTTAFVMPPPFAYEKNDPSRRITCRYRIVFDGNDLELSLQLPLGWLNDPERSFPVVVDPTFENYETGSWVGAQVYDGGYYAQSFQEDDCSYNMTSVQLLVRDDVVVDGDDSITVEIQTDSAGVPSGTIVTNGGPITVNVDPDNTFAWTTFTFSPAVTITTGTKYWIVATNPNTTSTKGYTWQGDQPSPTYANGNAAISLNQGTSWTGLTSNDMHFRAIGTATSPAKSITDGDISLTGQSTTDVLMSTAKAEVIQVQFDVAGCTSTLNLTEVKTKLALDATADVTKVQAWWNDSNDLATATQFGTDVTTISSTTQELTFTATRDLPNGLNYLWITMDIASSGVATDLNEVTAYFETAKITIDGTAYKTAVAMGNSTTRRRIKDGDVSGTYYVDATVDPGDGNPGGGTVDDPTDPFPDLTTVMDLLDNTIFIGPVIVEITDSTTYAEQVTVDNMITTAINNLTIRAETGETPTITGSSTRTFGIEVDGVDYVTLQDLRITAASGIDSALVRFDESDNGTIKGCTIFSSEDFLIRIDVSVDDLTIQDCVIYQSLGGSQGIRVGYVLEAVTNLTIKNCLIYECSGSGIVLDPDTGTTGIVIENNTFHRNTLDITAASTLNSYIHVRAIATDGVSIRNNIFRADHATGTELSGAQQMFIYADDATDISDLAGGTDYNLYFTNDATRFGDGGFFRVFPDWQTNTSADDNSIYGSTSDPNFVDSATGTLADRDYHLQSEYGHEKNDGTWGRLTSGTSSAGIDAGDPADAVGSELEDNGDRLNLGAYGGTVEASHSGSNITPATGGTHTVLSSNYWTGDGDGNWNNHKNWAHGKPGAIGADPPTSAANDEWGKVVYDPDDAGVNLDPNPTTTNLTLDTANGYAYSLTMPTGITGTLAVGANTLNIGDGGFDGNAGTLTLGAGTIKVSGNWDDTDGVGGQGVSFTFSTGTTEFNGTAAQTVTGDTTNQFFNGTINNSHVSAAVTASGELNFAGTLTISDGTFEISSSTTTVTVNLTVSGSSTPELSMTGSGTLKLGNASTLTIGDATTAATFTASGGSATTITTSGTAGTNHWGFLVRNNATLSVSKSSGARLNLISLDLDGVEIQEGAIVNNGTSGELKGIGFSQIETNAGAVYLNFTHTTTSSAFTFQVKQCDFDDVQSPAASTPPFNIRTSSSMTAPADILVDASFISADRNTFTGYSEGSTHEDDKDAGQDNAAGTSTIIWPDWIVTVEISPSDSTAVVGMAIRFYLNGTDTDVQLTDSNGQIEFSGIVANDILLFYRDVGANSETYVGNPLTAAVTEAAGLNGATTLYLNYLVLTHDNAGTLTITDLDTADGGGGIDTDIPYKLTAGNVDFRNTGTDTTMNVRTLNSFSPGGDVGWVNGTTGNIEATAGTFTVAAGETLAMEDATSITVSGGTFAVTGTSASDATLTVGATNSESFSMTVASGGTLKMQYFTISNLGTAGLVIDDGATVNEINYGTFTTGATNTLFLDISAVTQANRSKLPWSFLGLEMIASEGDNIKTGRMTPQVMVTGDSVSNTRWGEAYDDDPAEAFSDGSGSGRVFWKSQILSKLQGSGPPSPPPTAFASFQQALDSSSVFGGHILRATVRWPLNENLDLNANGDKDVSIDNAVFLPQTGNALDNGDAPAGNRGTARNCIVLQGSVEHWNLENCTLYDPGSGTVTVTSCAATNCIFDTAPTLDSGSTNINSAATSLFVGAADYDFHLRSSSTSAIDQGTALTYTSDYEGHTRPLDGDNADMDNDAATGAEWDIGADEHYPKVGATISTTPDAVNATNLGSISQFRSAFRGGSRFTYVITRGGSSGGDRDNMLVLLDRTDFSEVFTFEAAGPIHGMIYSSIKNSGSTTEFRLFLLVDTDSDGIADGIQAVIDTYTGSSGTFTHDDATTATGYIDPSVAQTDANKTSWYRGPGGIVGSSATGAVYVDRSFDTDGIVDGVNKVPGGGGGTIAHLVYRKIAGEGDGSAPSDSEDARRWSRRIFLVSNTTLYKINADPLDVTDDNPGNQIYGEAIWTSAVRDFEYRAPIIIQTTITDQLWVPVSNDTVGTGANANQVVVKMPWDTNTAPAGVTAGWRIEASTGQDENRYGHVIKLGGPANAGTTFIHVAASDGTKTAALRANQSTTGNYWTTAALNDTISSAPLRPLPAQRNYVFVGAGDRIEKIKDNTVGADPDTPWTNGLLGWNGSEQTDTDGDLTTGYGTISSNLTYITTAGVSRLFWGTQQGFAASFKVELALGPVSSDEEFDAGFPYEMVADEVTAVRTSFEGATTGWSVIFVTRNGRVLKFLLK